MALRQQAHNSIVITLIAAGGTAWAEDERILGAADLPLTDEGRAAASSSAARVRTGELAIIHHPPDEAATETAEIIAAAHGLKTKVVDELANPHLGLLEGLTMQAFAERYPKRRKQLDDDPLSLHPPEGEALEVARARVFGAIAKLLRRSKTSEIAIVLHDLAFGLLRAWLADRPAREMSSIAAERPPVERYVLTAEGIQRLEAVAATEQPA